MKVLSVVGARPQFVKAAMVSRELRKTHQEILVHTGQHYDYPMSQVFFDELGIPEPDYSLGVGSGSHGAQTGQMLERIEQVLLTERPDWMIVYGDTNSTLAGALAAAKLHVPVAHVEAGLRSLNRRMPEETNRVLADHISALLFCPTETAGRNLASEGIASGVYNIGDVMYDAALHYVDLAEAYNSRPMERLGLKPGQYLLATVHRPDNTDDGDHLRSIWTAFHSVDEKVVLPAHPRVKKALDRLGLRPNGNVQITEPVGYLDMLVLEKHARMILTDSGGVQKEACFFGVPCITLRFETEWVETVAAGWNVLAGADTVRILEAVQRFRPSGEHPRVFGDGRASQDIVATLEKVQR